MASNHLIAPLPYYRQRHVLAIDSRNREDFANTTPSHYIVKFPVFKNIKMVRMISSEIPNTQYVFQTGINNTFDLFTNFISSGGAPAGTYTITIAPGTYTGGELADEINNELNIAMLVGFGIEFVATYITFSQKIQIDYAGADPLARFRLLWATGPSIATSCAKELGYQPAADTALAITSSSTVPVFLSGENYVYLCIKDMAGTRVTENIEDVFAKIIFNVPPRSITFDSFASNEIVFPEPLPYLNRFEVTFRLHDGSEYNFNTIEHSFTIEMYTV